jgi:cardiolipin synthase
MAGRDPWREPAHLLRKLHYYDRIGHEFADDLTTKANEGVCVRHIYHWIGAMGSNPRSRGFWNRMREAGVEVRCYNPS